MRRGGAGEMPSMRLRDPHFATLGREKGWEMRPKAVDEATGLEKRADWVVGTRIRVERADGGGEPYVVEVKERRDYPAVVAPAFERALADVGVAGLLPGVDGVDDVPSGAAYYRQITPAYADDERDHGAVAWRVERV